MHYTFADIFCGAGGFSWGFRDYSEHLWGLDADPYACATYQANIGRAIQADVASVDWTAIARPDVLIGAPPCQGFSQLMAARVAPDDPKNGLVWGFVWAVATLRPQAFVMENVLGLSRGTWTEYPLWVKGALETLGYRVTVMKLNAADYGVPQIRRRIFWAGIRGSSPIGIPAATHSSDGIFGTRWVTVREALGLPVDRPSYTVTATEYKGRGGRSRRASDTPGILNGQSRLSVEECMTLMGFPRGYVLRGSLYKRYALVGNAVCPAVAKAIAKEVHNALDISKATRLRGEGLGGG